VVCAIDIAFCVTSSQRVQRGLRVVWCSEICGIDTKVDMTKDYLAHVTHFVMLVCAATA
jgi:hypothetical protein